MVQRIQQNLKRVGAHLIEAAQIMNHHQMEMVENRRLSS